MLHRIVAGLICVVLVGGSAAQAADDLSDIKTRGVIRHIGVPYANFVSGAGDGFSVDIVKGFAAYLGVRYQYVETDWGTVIQDLIGRKVKVVGGTVEMGAAAPMRGDLIANGLTVIPWRSEVIRYSTPVFPTEIWLVARADSPIRPIEPSGDLDQDIAAVRSLLRDLRVLGKVDTCLDPTLYAIAETGAKTILFDGPLNDMAGALMQKEADAALLDVPDAFVALRKWPGRIKVIGPLSRMQAMAVGFRPDAPRLRQAFEAYLKALKTSGAYRRIVEKYYPLALSYFPGFFE